MDVERFIARLRGLDFYQGQIVHQHREAGRPATAAPGRGLSETAQAVCDALDVDWLYAHQAEALRVLREGRDLVLNSGRAAGKSLVFQLAAVEKAHAEPPGSTLILCPNKSVGAAQRRKFARIAGTVPAVGRSVTRYDGDLGSGRRRSERGRPICITNPDMLNRGILPNHPKWADWFSRLQLVVVEELHAYSGLFGSNVAALMRRLWRVCEHYGARPQCVCTTSTSSNPALHALRLLHRRAQVLRQDDSPSGGRRFLLWRPTTAAPTRESGRLAAELLARGHGAIAFSRARVAVELIAEYARRELREKGLSPDRVLCYRGGLRPEERAELEERMHAGEPVFVSATNALELGLDLPALDASIVCGWPGALHSFYQQAARAGRAGRDALVFYVGLHDPVNAFLLSHPEYIFERPVESGVVELANPHVLAAHLRCAAQELPLRQGELERFGPAADEVLQVLENRRKLYPRDGVWYNASGDRPARDLSMRGSFERNVVVQDADTGRVVAEVDWMGAHQVVHPRAVYLHEGRQYRVRDFDREQRRATVEGVNVDFYTNPLGHCFVHSVDECLREHELPGGTLFFGEVTAGAVTTGYEERRYETNELIRSVELELPPVLWETMGLWVCLGPEREAELTALGLTPEYYGLGNAVRIVLPAFMTCDVLDLRPWAGQTNFPWPALYFYERYRRGLGFAERVFESAENVLAATADNLADCECADGCPLCVGDPPRPFMVNNPELEADLIPSRAEVRLLLESLRRDEPMEDLLTDLFGRRRAEEMLAGRRELLRARRNEASELPRRRLPSDAPARSAEPRRRMPLQLERGVRRRIEKMRTVEQNDAQKAVREAAVPEPEAPDSLPPPDAAARRGHADELKRRRLKELARRRAFREKPTDRNRVKSERPPDEDPSQTDMAAEAVRRVRRSRKRDGS